MECKAAPYRTGDERERIELAKDISGLANANGGLILVGVRTERAQDSREDVIRAVTAFERRLLDAAQYQAILASTVYPTMNNVEFRWFESPEEPGRGVYAIVIPPQQAKPYLVMRTLTDEGRRVEVLVGYFERRRAGVDHMSTQRLQALLRDGLRFDEVLLERLEDIQRLVRNAQPHAQPEPPPRIAVTERLEETVAAAQLPAGPQYVLAASPQHPVVLRGFGERNSELARLVAEPPSLRAHGFDLAADTQAHLVRGELLRSRLAGWKALDVWRDGFIAFAAPGNQDFLCWGRTPFLINPLVLAETCYLFSELSRRVLQFAETPPLVVEFRLELRDAITAAGTLALPPYQLGALRAMALGERHEAPEARRQIIVQHAPDAPAGQIAFSLLRELYLWFGYHREEMPYVRGEGGVHEINPADFAPGGGD